MIRYALICDEAHSFESWFATSASFEQQAQRGLVACPFCRSAKVERAIMAPHVARTDRGRSASREPPDAVETDAPAMQASAAAEPSSTALISDKDIAIRKMLSAIHEHVTQNAEPVGPRFAKEALKMHHGETESRAIYGQATADEARMLQEEGVGFMPLPSLPEGRN